MPTKKQRRRLEKGRRHEYETVWVDDEGNELEEPPEDVPARAPRNAAERKPGTQKRQSQSSSTRVPPEPSWQRSIRRSLLIGAVFLVVLSMMQGPLIGSMLAVFYTALFIPFTYYMDRFVYRRWERNQAAKATKKKKR
jgi:hypothetical protein